MKELATAGATTVLPIPVRRAISRMVLDLRETIEGDYRKQLRAIGVDSSGIGPIPSGRTLADDEVRVREVATAVVGQVVAAGASPGDAVERFVRESAFTFLNRAIGFRCLEERELLLVDGQSETLWVVDAARNASSLYWRVRTELPPATPPREIWRAALRRASAGVSQQVRVLFDPDSEYAALLPLQPTLSKVADALNAVEIPPETYRQDELLGWVYQYYNTREKDAVYERLGKGKKIERPEELAAATCLYTERYMVDYLLQNTLGAFWIELHPGTKLPASWPYYVKSPNSGQSPLTTGEGPKGYPGEGHPPATARRLRDITLLDPACGSGHFLVRAFDLFAAMYVEEGIERAEEIPQLILANNLHGIDIDARSIQIAALALYLKGCALGGPGFRPRRLNLVAADAVLPGDSPPEAYLKRFQGNKEDEDLVKGIWRALKNVGELGSLLHPERAVDEVVKRRRERERGTLWETDEVQWSQWKQDLLAGLREEFELQAQTSDLGQRLFGEEAAKGVSLVEALGRKYDVVVANPPYQGSGSLNDGMKTFLAKEYKDGKSDLYAAFILRCRDFARLGGHVGMVTQQSWMFLRTFAALRKDILERTSLTTIAHLGPRAFSEISGEVVNIALFTLRAAAPTPVHRLVGFRLVGPKSPREKERMLLAAVGGQASGVVSKPRQAEFVAIPETPFVYWLRPKFFELLKAAERIGRVADVRQGLATADNDRFTRCFWEVEDLGVVVEGKPISGRWFKYAKGGRYQKWVGLDWLVVDWETDGFRIKNFRGPDGRIASRPQNETYYFRDGLTYSPMGRGSMGARVTNLTIFDVKGASLFLASGSYSIPMMAALLSSRVCSFVLRVATQYGEMHVGYVSNVPLPQRNITDLPDLGNACIIIKRWLVSLDLTERAFAGPSLARSAVGGLSTILFRGAHNVFMIQALLHTLEGANERAVCDAYGLDAGDVQAIVEETGTPAGWYPLLDGRDTIQWSDHPPSIVAQAQAEAEHILAMLPRQTLSAEELARLERRARALFDAGQGVSVSEQAANNDGIENEDEAVVGAFIPIPTETFVEELAQKLKIHPISVAHIISGFIEYGDTPSDPFSRRQVEDYFAYVVLRVFGYLWPTPPEAELAGGRHIAKNAISEDGIIPLVTCGDDVTLERRVIQALGSAGEDGPLPRPPPRGEGREERGEADAALFRAVTGRELGDWLRKDFFKRHIQQFKQRPIAWHFVSPERTFEAFVLYHKLSLTTLQALRTQYAGSLVEKLTVDLARAKERKDEAAMRKLQAQIEDVDAFRERIARIERGDDLKARIRCRWKGEEESGRPGPYAPDIDDGVKVNIRPFQELGLLAAKVITKW